MGDHPAVNEKTSRIKVLAASKVESLARFCLPAFFVAFNVYFWIRVLA